MPLSWNEIKDRALAFSREWEGERSERAEAKTFWDQFFNVFGIDRRRVASFEKPVKTSEESGGYIDLLWKGQLLVEHKSRGRDLNRAYKQATDYFYGLKDRDLPQYVIVSDFARFRLCDLKTGKETEFALKDFHKQVGLFAFIAGYETHRVEEREESANIKAAEQLGALHDLLKASGYEGHKLEVLLVRLLFCLFADDTGIFPKNTFREYLDLRTNEDGSDLGLHLAKLFQVLNTPEDERSEKLDQQLAQFTFVDGRLFEEALPMADFDSSMRESLLDACALDWSAISPAIFGSLFQSIMDPEARRNLGAHYTRELNILKALKPLFLDGLHEEFETLKRNPRRLVAFQNKLATIRVLDPACGCGNFLVIAYRELRLLELAVLHELYKVEQSSRTFDIRSLVLIDVDQFYGIEIEEFPCQIAQVALWLTDHQVNLRVSEDFGKYFARLPLVKSPNIVRGNALQMNWSDIVDAATLSFVVGNPPFVGKAYQSEEQKADMRLMLGDVPGSGVLDYVTCWYRKATDYMAGNPAIRAAFVSTKSITQGEQVGILWPHLIAKGIHFVFAHRAFDWSSEAAGAAAVDCVIIGFSLTEPTERIIFDYETPASEPHALSAQRISPYLVDGPTVFVQKRRTPISASAPEMAFGNMPNDGGHLLLTGEEKTALVREEPDSEKWLHPLMGADELLYGVERWCLWLPGISPAELRLLPKVAKRVEAVRLTRLASRRSTTQRLADTPTLFGEIRQPATDYLALPEVSSEDRRYIPVAFLPARVIATNKLYTVAGASLYEFGIISSLMHMAWLRAVAGRLESRYQYSAGIVYNNFPWPSASESQRQRIDSCAQNVLDARAQFPDANLADLYHRLAMPPALLEAHRTLDRAVDVAYGKSNFATEAERVAFLFVLYERMTTILTTPPEPRRRRSTRRRRPPLPGN